MLENKHPAFERHPQNNSIMPEIMLYKQHYARLKLRLYLMPLFIPADLNTKFYCIFSQSQQPNKMMQRCKKTLQSSNQAFQHANSHLKHLEAKISQYNYHTYVIIIFFFIIILFMLKKKWRLCRCYARWSDNSIMPKIMLA